MSERQLMRLFAAVEPEEADTGCGPRCVSTEELVQLAGPTATPADPERLARVAACGACSEALSVLTAPDRVGKPVSLQVLRTAATGRRWRRWGAAALAVAAAVLVLVALQLIRGGGEPGDVEPQGARSAQRIEREAVVLFVEGAVHRKAGGAALSAGDSLAAGAEIRFSPGARIGLLDRSGGGLRVVSDRDGRTIAIESPALADLARELGPQYPTRRRLVEGLPDGVPRDRRPDFLALEPRGGVRSDRPEFRFQADLIGPDEDLILRVLDEDGVVHLEHRFRGTRAVRFPANRPPLERGRRYVWSVSHPRSGPGPLGGEPFKVIGADALRSLEQGERALGRLVGGCPEWVVAVLRAVLLHHAGLEKEALEALPARAPDPRLSDFILEERALILDELGLNEQIGPLKKQLGLDQR